MLKNKLLITLFLISLLLMFIFSCITFAVLYIVSLFLFVFRILQKK